jgi:hypothetical protein
VLASSIDPQQLLEKPTQEKYPIEEKDPTQGNEDAEEE